VIQHSIDGRNFVDIGTVSGSNTSGNQYYSYTHSEPVKGNNYYRIKQVDNDGKVSYSKLLIYFYGENSSFRVLTNPVVNGQMSVQIIQSSVLMLFNSEGKLIKKEQLSTGNHNISVSNLAKGMYTVLVGTEAKKILVSN
jgi:hypothetical protein